MIIKKVKSGFVLLQRPRQKQVFRDIKWIHFLLVQYSTFQVESLRHQTSHLHFRDLIFFSIGEVWWEGSSPIQASRGWLLLTCWLRHCQNVAIPKRRKESKSKGK